MTERPKATKLAAYSYDLANCLKPYQVEGQQIGFVDHVLHVDHRVTSEHGGQAKL